MFFKKNKKGETLIEVTIALAILAIVLVGVLKVLGNSKVSAESAEKRMQAVSLAREGIEMVRYIRELNYMKYSNQKRICWNFHADNNGDGVVDFGAGDSSCADLDLDDSADDIFAESTYYAPLQNLSSETNGRYFLSGNSTLTEAAWDSRKDGGQIYSVAGLEYFRLCKDATSGFITSCNSPGIVVDKSLPFFRGVELQYVNVLGQSCSDPAVQNLATTKDYCDDSVPSSLNHIKITSTVLFMVGPKAQSVELTTILSDSRDRTDRDS